MLRLRPASNQKGSMLLQTLMGLGILGIITIAMISFFKFSASSQRRLRALQAFNDQVSLAQLSLDDVKACTYNLGTVGTGPGSLDGITLPAVGSDMLIELKKYDADNPLMARASAPSIFLNGAGQDLDNTLKVLDVKLKTLAKISNNRYIGNVIIHADRVGGSMGSDEITQAFPIYIATDSVAKVLYCYGNYASGGLMDLQQKQCETLMGSGYYWNPKTNSCDTRFETKCFPGGQAQASCDPATTFGLSGQGCSASGVIDPMASVIPPPTRFYADGGSAAPRFPGPVDCRTIDAYTVACNYATDVDASGATCSACCKVEKEDAAAANPLGP